jgi:hypothetical protein
MRAKFLAESGWTQQAIAERIGKSQTWVVFMLTFGRFLDHIITSGNNPLSIPANLTERRFRAYWANRLAKLKLGSNQHAPKVDASNDAPTNGVAIADAAKLLNVGRASVDRAKHVLGHGSSALVEAEKMSTDIRTCPTGWYQWYLNLSRYDSGRSVTDASDCPTSFPHHRPTRSREH